MLRPFGVTWDPPLGGLAIFGAAWDPLLSGLAAAVLSGAVVLSAQAPAGRTVWDGIYTDGQARRGASVYNGECSYCHKDDLTGGFFDGDTGQATPLAGPRAFGSSFADRWND